MDIQQAVSILTKAINDDPALFYAYQSNIAVPFQDEVRRQGIHISDEKLHEISNNAAKYFLQLWVGHRAVKASSVAEPVPADEAPNAKPEKKGGKKGK